MNFHDFIKLNDQYNIIFLLPCKITFILHLSIIENTAPFKNLPNFNISIEAVKIF